MRKGEAERIVRAAIARRRVASFDDLRTLAIGQLDAEEQLVRTLCALCFSGVVELVEVGFRLARLRRTASTPLSPSEPEDLA
jgi:hypothetical protein